MKRIIILFLAIATLVSCSQTGKVKSVAEKALAELGNGKYAGEYFGKDYFNFNIICLYDSPYFANYEIDNYEAKNFIERRQTKYDRILKNDFFETDKLFNDIVFVDLKGPYARDIYFTNFFSSLSDNSFEAYGGFEKRKELQEYCLRVDQDKPGFYKDGYDYCYIKHESVPFYKLTYKLDNKYLATVTVAVVEGEDPKVTSVYIR